MTSSNGKIPAGSASLDLSSMRQGFSSIQTTPIDKCPDKLASANYTISLDYLRTVTRNGSHNKQSSTFSRGEDSNSGSGSRIRNMASSPSYQNLRGSDPKFSSYNKPSMDRKILTNASSAYYQLANRSNQERDTDSDMKSSKI